jgi:hypothetical protein
MRRKFGRSTTRCRLNVSGGMGLGYGFVRHARHDLIKTVFGLTYEHRGPEVASVCRMDKSGIICDRAVRVDNCACSHVDLALRRSRFQEGDVLPLCAHRAPLADCPNRQPERHVSSALVAPVYRLRARTREDASKPYDRITPLK